MKNWHFTFKMVEKTFVWPKLFKHTLARYMCRMSTFPANLPCCQVRWGQNYENKQV